MLFLPTVDGWRPLMGIKLITEVMDYRGDLSLPEWKALVVLAEDANDQTRRIWSAVTGEKIMQRIGLAPTAWANLRGKLVRRGLLEVVEAGRRGRCAKYRFPDPLPMPHLAGEASEGMTHPVGDEYTFDHLSGEESDPMPHSTGEASAECLTQEVTPTPPSSSTPPPPTTTPRARANPPGSPKEGGGGDQHEAAHPPNPAAVAVIDALPYVRWPSRRERLQLLAAATAFLAAGFTDGELKTHLITGLETMHDRVRVWITRLDPDYWPDEATSSARASSEPRASPKPPCLTRECDHHNHHATCNKRGFLIDDDHGQRCPCWHTPEARF